jgi:hypothetical protein
LISTRTAPPCREDCGQLVSFPQQLREFSIGEQVCIAQQFQPVHRLIRFFSDNAKFGCKLSTRARPACCTVISSDRSSRAHELTSNCASRHCPRQMIHEVQNSQTETLCAREKFRFAHDANLHQTSTVKHQTFPAKNGLCTFSSPTVVIGPCPGQMMVSSGSVRIFSRLFRNASS